MSAVCSFRLRVVVTAVHARKGALLMWGLAEGLGASVLPAGASVLPSLITGLAGLAGVLTGGLITRSVTLSAEDKRQAAESQREAATVRGVARLMHLRYRQVGTVLRVMADRKGWLGHLEQVAAPLALEDQKLIAAAATVDEWYRIQVAEFNIRTVVTLRDSSMWGDNEVSSLPRADAEENVSTPTEASATKLDAGEIEFLLHAESAVSAAEEILLRLAELPIAASGAEADHLVVNLEEGAPPTTR